MFNDLKCKKNKQLLYFSIYLFLIIFAPPFIPHINSMIVISVVTLFYLIVCGRCFLLKMLNNKYIKRFLILYCLFLIYLFLVIFINASSNIVNYREHILVAYRFILICPIFFICILNVLFLTQKYNFTTNDIIECIIIAGFIQVFITICCLLFPMFKQLCINLLYFFTHDSIYLNGSLQKYRFNGYSESLLDSFGFGTGVIAALPLFLSIRIKKPSLILLCGPLILVPLFNARSGVIIFGLLFFIFLFHVFFRIEKKYKIIYIKYLLSFIVIILCTFLLGYIFFPKNIKSFFIDSFSIIRFLFTGNLSMPGVDTASNLFNSKSWVLPNNLIDVIFGTGHTVFIKELQIKSDVGYINDIWLVGIVGSILMYLPYIYIYISCYKKSNDSLGKSLAIGLMLALFIFQIKGRAFMYSAGTATSLILVFSMLINTSLFNNDNKE